MWIIFTILSSNRKQKNSLPTSQAEIDSKKFFFVKNSHCTKGIFIERNQQQRKKRTTELFQVFSVFQNNFCIFCFCVFFSAHTQHYIISIFLKTFLLQKSPFLRVIPHGKRENKQKKLEKRTKSYFSLRLKQKSSQKLISAR